VRSLGTCALAVTLMALTVEELLGQARDEIRCDYSRRVVCSEAGCKSIPVGNAFLVIPPLEELSTFDPEFDKMPEIRRLMSA
jgi:hypothetical protein